MERPEEVDHAATRRIPVRSKTQADDPPLLPEAQAREGPGGAADDAGLDHAAERQSDSAHLSALVGSRGGPFRHLSLGARRRHGAARASQPGWQDVDREAVRAAAAGTPGRSRHGSDRVRPPTRLTPNERERKTYAEVF